jgi:dihydrofolate reductase
MRKLIMWNLITLDGCFEGEKQWDLDFHGLAWGDELEHFISEQLKTIEMLVFGENTYEGMAKYWANETGEVADYMNKLPKIVCSTTRTQADWNNTIIVKDAVTEIARLKGEGEGNMFVFGSGNLSRSLMRASLFDEYRLCIVPVFLGKGSRLFGEDVPYEKLKLIEDQQLTSGGVILRYSPAR